MYVLLLALLLALTGASGARATALDLSGALAVEVATTGTFDDPEIGVVSFSAGANGVLQAGSPIGVDCQSGPTCWLDDPGKLNWLESMTIDFGTSGALLHSVTVSDLDVLGSLDTVRLVDGGYIDTGNCLIAFSALDAVDGTLTVAVEQNVQSIRLTTSNLRGASYRLAGVSYGVVTPAPEGPAISLYASGGLLVLLATWRKLLRA